VSGDVPAVWRALDELVERTKREYEHHVEVMADVEAAGCDQVSGNTCTVTMNQAKNVTANFVPGRIRST
jgi:hypothetical protein